MDFFQVQDFFKEMYPGKEITYEFDDNCHRTVEVIFTGGKPHLTHHVECNRVKVNISGEQSKYVPIAPHRIGTSWDAAKKYILNKNDVHIHEDDIKAYKDAKDESEKSFILKRLIDYSGMSEDSIKKILG